MVQNSVTDGKRIAQLLASEITGLQSGGLDGVSVAESDPDAMPSETGTLAYRIVGDATLASVSLYPAYVELEFADSLPPEVGDPTVAEQCTVQVTSGTEVKAAVDLIRAVAGDG